MSNVGLYIIGVVLLLEMANRHFLHYGRKKLKARELVALFGGGALEEEALRKLAALYGIPVGVLRPDDQFGGKSILCKYDFDGLGGERLDEFLYGNGVTNRLPDNWTVGDYVSWYVARKKAGTLKDVPID